MDKSTKVADTFSSMDHNVLQEEFKVLLAQLLVYLVEVPTEILMPVLGIDRTHTPNTPRRLGREYRTTKVDR